MKKRTKFILIFLILLATGLFLAKYVQPYKFTLTNKQTSQENFGVLDVHIIFMGEHECHIEIDKKRYSGKCDMVSTKNYDYQGSCKLINNNSYITCDLNATIGTDGHKIDGTCIDNKNEEYIFTLNDKL